MTGLSGERKIRFAREQGALLSHPGLPVDLLKSARSRVSYLALFVFGFSLLGSLILFPLLKDVAAASRIPGVVSVMVVTVCSCSLILFGLSRLKQISPQLLLDLALGYEVVLAFATALARHSIPWEEGIYRDWSEVAVWIIVFSVVIPNTPGKTFVAALLASLTDPIGLLIAVAADNPMPSTRILIHLFGPTVFAVILAMILSRYIFRMGQDIEQARQMGSYHLEELLGRGGMGEVWRASHHMLAKPAAVKLISREFLRTESGDTGSEDQLLKRFEREATLTAQLESEHTIQLFDYGSGPDGSFYYVMEYLNGKNLQELVVRFGPIPPERTIYLLLQVCDSLAEAHGLGFIHRDIKPANIFLCRKGFKCDHAKVLDFGLVRNISTNQMDSTGLTMKGTVPGTPAFIAPELATYGQKVNGRADLYSLGCVAYWLLSGCLVFEADSPLQMVLHHLNSPPPPLSSRTEFRLPPGLERLVHRCLEKDPERRPSSAAELACELKKIPLPRPWNQERATRWWRSHLPEHFTR